MPHPIVRNRRQPIASSGDLGYPGTIPDLAHLWKADSLVLNDGDLVSTWIDQKVGKTATAAGTARPTFKTGIFGTKPVLRFNGTTNVMTIGGGGFTFNRNTGGTMFLVTAWTTTVNHKFVTSDVSMSPGDQIFVSDGANFFGSNPISNAKKMIALQYLLATVTLRSNKTAPGGIVGAYTQNFPNTLFGGHVSATSWFVGDLAEVICYNRQLTNAECDGMFDNYLQPKYAL